MQSDTDPRGTSTFLFLLIEEIFILRRQILKIVVGSIKRSQVSWHLVDASFKVDLEIRLCQS